MILNHSKIEDHSRANRGRRSKTMPDNDVLTKMSGWSRKQFRGVIERSSLEVCEIKLITVTRLPLPRAKSDALIDRSSWRGATTACVSLRADQSVTFRRRHTGQRTGKLPVRSYHDPGDSARESQ